MRPHHFRKAGFKVSVVSKIRRSLTKAYTKDWSSISAYIMKRDGYRCRECGATRSERRLEVHHIIPISRGGQTVPYNLRTLCYLCHERKPGHSHIRHRHSFVKVR